MNSDRINKGYTVEELHRHLQPILDRNKQDKEFLYWMLVKAMALEKVLNRERQKEQ